MGHVFLLSQFRVDVSLYSLIKPNKFHYILVVRYKLVTGHLGRGRHGKNTA